LPLLHRAARFLAAAFTLILLSLPATAQSAGDVRFEQGIPAKVRDAVSRAVPGLLRVYASLLDAEPYTRPALSVTWEAREEDGWKAERAADAGAASRVRLSGKDWADPPPAALAALLEAVASELARVWSTSIHRPDPDVPAWVIEGNSRLLAIAALLRLGLASPGDTARRMNIALNTCFAQPGHDACELAIHFALVALAQRRDPALDAFAFWRDLWKAYPRYGVRSIAEFARERMPQDAARFVPDAFGPSSRSLDATVLHAVRSAFEVDLPAPPPDVYASHILGGLMRLDCSGKMAFWTNNDHLYTDDVPGCKFFRGGWKLRRMAGRDLLREPRQAALAARATCTGEGKLVFGTLDGEEHAMPCDAAIAARLPNDLRVANLAPLRVARVLSRP
jgi:hypothetical protein